MKKQDCTDDIDWADQTLQTLVDAANFGVTAAQDELDKRRKAMEKLGTVTPKFAIEDGE